MFDDDHRKLGKRLGLFHFQDEAPGMVFWHPRGWALYRALEEAVRRRMVDGWLPRSALTAALREAIWEASGHAENFSDGMFAARA
jgi:threonyl-tRNA synthetase